MQKFTPGVSVPPQPTPDTPLPSTPAPPVLDPESALAALGLALPVAARPVAAYIPARILGAQLYISGQIPVRDGVPLFRGLVGQAVTLEEGQACARQCVLNGLAAAKAALGDLRRIRGVARVGVFVACGPEFTAHPQVANGASELLVGIFGEAGRHARAAVGCSSLPLGVPVEVEFLFEVE